MTKPQTKPQTKPTKQAKASGHFVDHLPLDEVPRADRNPKGHDSAGISRSLGKYGMAELPLMDDRTGKLIAGHGRLEQLIEMRDSGKEPPSGVGVDEQGRWLMPVIRGWASRSDDDAAAYLIASNRLVEAGGWDTYELAEMLDDIHDAQLLEFTGYDESELEAMKALLRDPDSGEGSDDDVLNATDRASWPVIRAQVPPEVHQRWNLIEGNDDAARIRNVLDLAGI